MMRGTVYVVMDIDTPTLRAYGYSRYWLDEVVTTTQEFKSSAEDRLRNAGLVPAGCRVEFGSIGFRWDAARFSDGTYMLGDAADYFSSLRERLTYAELDLYWQQIDALIQEMT